MGAITAALEGAAARRGTTVVLTGPPGAGFSAVLEAAAHTARATPRWLLVRARAVQEEAGIERALLQQLVSPLVEELDRLAAAGEELAPAPRAALDTASGWAVPAPGQVPLSMAVLWGLEVVARSRPVLLAVDDVPWADPASLEVLRFLTRRLSGVSACLLLAAPGAEPALDWPDADRVLELAPLEPAAAEALLARVAPDSGPHARERVVRLAAGRPRRLVDLGRLAQASAPTATTVALHSAALPWVQRAVQELRTRPEPERRRLLLAGLLDDPAGAPLVRRAEHLLAGGARPDAPADARYVEGLTEPLAEAVPDPLLAEVAAEGVEPEERSRAHRAWVAVLEPAAATARDQGRAELAVRLAAEARRQEGLALVLAAPSAPPEHDETARRGAAAPRLRAAARELVRHDPRRAGDLLTLAAQLEDDDARRTDLLRAAEVASALGRTLLAGVLTERAGAPRTPLDEAVAARTDAVRALARGEHEAAAGQLVRALQRCADAVGQSLEPSGTDGAGQEHDGDRGPGGAAALAQDEALLTAAVLAVVARRSADSTTDSSAGRALRGAGERLPDSLAARVRRLASLLVPWRDAVPEEQLEALLEALDVLDRGPVPVLRWAADVARALGRGDLVLAVAGSRAPHLTGPAAVDLHLARYAASLDSSIARAERHIEAARGQLRHAPELAPAVAQAQAVVDVVRCYSASELEGPLPPVEPLTTETDGARWAHAQSHRLRGEVQLAAQALRPLWVAGRAPSTGALVSSIPYVMSLKASGADPAELRAVLDQVAAWAQGSGAPLARVSRLLCEALTSDDLAEQEALLTTAAAQGGPALVTGTAQLALGMLLRRARRAVAARDPLQRAAEVFEGAGMPGFARQAQRELAATAPQRPLRRVGSRELTSQEREVAHLAAQGASNAEVALSLGISSRTVAHHLQKVYAKLGITGRQQLSARLDRV
nr:LuxR family transcriptional regulator [Quadrisphaera sp. RL12-1S]